MERNTLCNRGMKESNDKKVTDSWDLLGEFSWPPRFYSCSFCKREFRSAQALGGHMNVHRRDRARLRQSPPTDNNGQYSLLNLNLEPNPNPNPHKTMNPNPNPYENMMNPNPNISFPPFNSSLPQIFPPSLPSMPSCFSETLTENKWGKDAGLVSQSRPLTTKTLFGVENLSSFVQEKDFAIIEKSEIVMPSIGSNEDLDLELRLGYL